MQNDPLTKIHHFIPKSSATPYVPTFRIQSTTNFFYQVVQHFQHENSLILLKRKCRYIKIVNTFKGIPLSIQVFPIFYSLEAQKSNEWPHILLANTNVLHFISSKHNCQAKKEIISLGWREYKCFLLPLTIQKYIQIAQKFYESSSTIISLRTRGKTKKDMAQKLE